MTTKLSLLIAALFMCISINIFAQQEGALQDFTLINETGVVIHKVFISPNDDNNWGGDILGTDVFMNESETNISFEPIEDVCLWDLKIEDSEGNAIEWNAIDLCKWLTVTLHWDGETATATFE